ncbi:ParA family protein [Pannonibacter carbonis]|uniref:ParA family protein n=1 Tax=Pannonibacter carbonis TaxID=2067569 RepID=UPI000D0FFF58|nr:ParA family protein [Pannonibacter carbonis]
MKTIAFVTQKGGAGKTTLAASLAVAAQDAGESVAVLDLDPQQSLTNWAADRTAETPAVDYLEPGAIPQLPSILKALEGRGYTLVILDTAGIDSTGTHIAMQAADLCLIPSRPTKMDLRATRATYEAAIRMQRPFLFALNQCPPQPNNPRATEAAQALSMLGLIAEPLIMQRADHQDAFASGLGVTEYASDGKAAEEVRHLWVWLKKSMKGKNHGETVKTKLVG